MHGTWRSCPMPHNTCDTMLDILSKACQLKLCMCIWLEAATGSALIAIAITPDTCRTCAQVVEEAAPSAAGAAAAAGDGDYSPHSDSGDGGRGAHKRGPRGTSSRFRGVTRHRCAACAMHSGRHQCFASALSELIRLAAVAVLGNGLHCH